MIRTAGLLLAAAILAGTPARAGQAGPEAPEMRMAREAVAEMRQSSVLPTPCERAFGAFWRVFEEPGDEPGAQGLVRDGSGPGEGQVFGYGNTAAQPLLREAGRICAAETDAPGDLVLRILREAALEKRERRLRIEEAHRLIKAY